MLCVLEVESLEDTHSLTNMALVSLRWIEIQYQHTYLEDSVSFSLVGGVGTMLVQRWIFLKPKIGGHIRSDI